MAITQITLNVADIDQSVAFYREFLDAEAMPGTTKERAVLDLGTAAIEFRLLTDGVASGWEEDDQVRGFRHLGFKVSAIDERVRRLKEANAAFRAELMDTGVGVRTVFFFDPDGTVLELIEGYVDYTMDADEDLVRTERAAGSPGRPRFDHVATTVHDAAATIEAYRAHGFRRIGAISAPGDERGFRIDYLLSGLTVLEVFSFARPTRAQAWDEHAFGFAGFRADGLTTGFPGSRIVAQRGTEAVYRDPDDLLYIIDQKASA